MATVVGRDVAPVCGMRVVITEEGRAWDINKAKRGDSSQGGSGSIVELREDGQVSSLGSCPQRQQRELACVALTDLRQVRQVAFDGHWRIDWRDCISAEQICMVQWDHKGEILPYPSGILNRFYLALEKDAAAALDESLSLSLVDDIGEDLPPVVSPSASQPLLSAATSGRKRKGSGQPSSPTKKVTSSGKGKEKKSAAHSADDGSDSVSRDLAPQVESQAVAEGSAAGAGEEEEAMEEGPESMVVLIDGKWRKVAMISAPTGAHPNASPARERTRRGLSFGDMGPAGGVQGNKAADDDAVDEEEDADEDMRHDAVDKDVDTFLSFLERAVSSQIHVASLAEMTRSRCYRERQLMLDVRFLDRAAARLPVDEMSDYMRHHIDAALHAAEPSAQEIQRLAFADVADEDEDDDGGGDDDDDDDAALDLGTPRSKKGGHSGKGRKTPTNKGAKQAGREVGGAASVVDWEVARAAVDAACVLLAAGCSRELHKREVMIMSCQLTRHSMRSFHGKDGIECNWA